MATQIMLLFSVENTKVTPSVIINPYSGSQGFANPPKLDSELIEGYTVNEIHRDVLNFANNLQRKED
jgi:hypothetical protein